MGCDGGTIPKRHELVKGPKKVEKVSGVGLVGTADGGAPRERGEVGGGASGFPDVAALLVPVGELQMSTDVHNGPLLSTCYYQSPGSTLHTGYLVPFAHRYTLSSSPRLRHGGGGGREQVVVTL